MSTDGSLQEASAGPRQMPGPETAEASDDPQQAVRTDQGKIEQPDQPDPSSPEALGESGSEAMGTLLEPVLRRACGDRLSPITWFRTDWQRGGAVTGYATFDDEQHGEQPVVVKLPVPPTERHWLAALQQRSDVVPRLYAHGDALNGYDLA